MQNARFLIHSQTLSRSAVAAGVLAACLMGAGAWAQSAPAAGSVNTVSPQPTVEVTTPVTPVEPVVEVKVDPVPPPSAAAAEAKRESQEAWEDVKDGSRQAWRNTKAAFDEGVLEGKLEMALALNKHLKPFKIETEVEGDRAILSGVVASAVERDLAASIAGAIEGIVSVDNRLTIDPAVGTAAARPLAEPARRDFAQFVTDASTTASIKTALLADQSIKGMKLNVDTYNNQVTLTGDVESDAQKVLAESIARKRDEVVKVINNIRVNS